MTENLLQQMDSSCSLSSKVTRRKETTRDTPGYAGRLKMGDTNKLDQHCFSRFFDGRP